VEQVQLTQEVVVEETLDLFLLILVEQVDQE
jgi:hypothetical protein